MVYIEQLIARDVINTMPQATLAAADHGDVPTRSASMPTTPTGCCATLRPLASTCPRSPVSSNMRGVRAFCDSYRELLACIDAKLADVTTPEAAA